MDTCLHVYSSTNPPKDMGDNYLNIMGGKGYNLCLMASAGLPVPPALIIGTNWCVDYMNTATRAEVVSKFIPDMVKRITEYHDFTKTLVSVRSGARVSMAGMMDTILNVGITPSTIDDHRAILGDRAAYDCYRRLIQMYGNVVDGIDHKHFDHLLHAQKTHYEVLLDSQLPAKALRELVTQYKALYSQHTNKMFPNTVEEQLKGAILAVFDSWNNERAIYYRQLNNIPDDWGTACVIQKMIFGNKDDDSGTGVLFTRNPSTGVAGVVGEFLVNAQGEDVVAGIRTPLTLNLMEDKWPKLHTQLITLARQMEKAKCDMQDMEFTVESGVLYFLQTRNAKRTSGAAVRVAIDLVKEELLLPDNIHRVLSYQQFLAADRPTIKESNNLPKPTGSGIPASNGVAVGYAAFTVESALELKSKNRPVILCTTETTPDDIKGMAVSEGILTATGGSTCHAAVVARGMDKVCVVGLQELDFSNPDYATLNGTQIYQGSTILTLCGTTGRVWVGDSIPLQDCDTGMMVELSKLIRTSTNSPKGIATVQQALANPKLHEDDLVILDNITNYATMTSLTSKGFSNFLVCESGLFPAMPYGRTFIDDLKDKEYYYHRAEALLGAKGCYYVTEGAECWQAVLKAKPMSYTGCKVFDISTSTIISLLAKGYSGAGHVLLASPLTQLWDGDASIIGAETGKKRVLGLKALAYLALGH